MPVSCKAKSNASRQRASILCLAADPLEGRIKLSDGRIDWKGCDGILGYWAQRRHKAPYHLSLRYSETKSAVGPIEAHAEILKGVLGRRGGRSSLSLRRRWEGFGRRPGRPWTRLVVLLARKMHYHLDRIIVGRNADSHHPTRHDLPLPATGGVRRDRLTSAVGPDASGSKPGIEWVQTPEKSGMDVALSLPLLAAPTVGVTCPKPGVAAAAASVTASRKYRRCKLMFSSTFHRIPLEVLA